MSGSRVIALLALCLAGSAHAEPKPPTEKDRQIASELVKKAIAKSQAGEHAAAIDIYLQAYTIVPNSILLSNIGTEFQHSGKFAEALRYFCMYLDKEPDGTNAPYATAQARKMQIELGNKRVDDRDVCAPARPEPRRKEPASEPEPRPRKPTGPEAEARPRGDSTLRYAGAVSSILGLAGLGVGAYAGIRASSISDQITSHDQSKPWPTNIRDLERRGQLYENLQVGSLIAGGVLVTAGVVLYVVGRPGSSEQATDKTVRVAPTANGIVVFGSF